MTTRTKVSETVARYLRMLQLVPVGRKVDAAYLERQLRVDGFDVHRRTIQRDLEMLAESFRGLTCDRATKPYGWAWDRRAPLHEFPAMGVQGAMTLELTRAHLAQALPRSTLRTLQPYFDKARATLRESAAAPIAKWLRKVQVVPRGLPLRPPQVAEAVLDVVYAALLEERRFTARYRTRGATRDKDYEVNPLGLVVRNGTLVLVCSFRDYPDVRQIVLHRMRSATLLDTRARVPKGFDLQAHVASGGVSFRLGKPFRLRLLMRKEASLTLHETPLSTDQRITSSDPADDLIEATVPDTLELRGWLASYGGLVEVLAPDFLRDEMARMAQEMSARYTPPKQAGRRRSAATEMGVETASEAEGTPSRSIDEVPTRTLNG